MRAYSMDLRVRVLADCDGGMTTKRRRRQVPRQPRLGPPPQAAPPRDRRSPRGAQRHGPPPRRSEHAAPRRRGRRTQPPTPPSPSCAATRPGRRPSTLWRAIARLGLTFKKKSLRAAEQDRPDVSGQAAAGRRRHGRRWTRRAAGVPRRDVGDHQHDPALRPVPRGAAAGDGGAARALEDDDVRGGAAGRAG